MERSIVKTACPLRKLSYVRSLVGDSNRYKTDKGEISLLHPCQATMGRYEIYCIEGDLFEDIERYDSLQESEARIAELLGE